MGGTWMMCYSCSVAWMGGKGSECWVCGLETHTLKAPGISQGQQNPGWIDPGLWAPAGSGPGWTSDPADPETLIREAMEGAR